MQICVSGASDGSVKTVNMFVPTGIVVPSNENPRTIEFEPPSTRKPRVSATPPLSSVNNHQVEESQQIL